MLKSPETAKYDAVESLSTLLKECVRPPEGLLGIYDKEVYIAFAADISRRAIELVRQIKISFPDTYKKIVAGLLIDHNYIPESLKTIIQKEIS